jgi:plasmid maintenance system killer protein
MIRPFRDADTEKVFRREFSRRFQSVAVVAIEVEIVDYH